MTNVSTDLAITGNGFFTVKDQNAGGTFFTRAGSFRKDGEGNLSLPSGHVLQAWKVATDGSLPVAKNDLNSLSDVNIGNLISEASATTAVDLSFNLNAAQEVAGKGAITFNILSSGATGSPFNAYVSKDDVLYANPSNSLTAGEGVTLQVGENSHNLIYGGVAQTLTFVNAGVGLVGAPADSFTVKVSDYTHTAFTRGAGTNNLQVLQNIADQINATSGAYALSARLVNDGTNTTLVVAPKDANRAMTFGGGTTLRTPLGLSDIKNTTAGTNRFASLTGLQSLLNGITGVTATVSSDENASITLKSEQGVYLNNYQPLGGGSDFLSEFGVSAGYIPSSYDPYDPANNMANGAFIPHFSKDITINDELGNANSFIVSFLKIDTNKWAVETYAVDKSAVDINGRIDGLVQAGIVNFQNGKLQGFIDPVQSASSKALSAADVALGATSGQTMTVAVGGTTHTFTYNPSVVSGSSIAGAGVVLAGGAPADTLVINVGTTAHTFTRGAGATDLDILNNVAGQINRTVGDDALRASVTNLGAGNYRLDINTLDITKDITITTGALGTDLGLTAADNLAADATRFKTLYELAERINETTGADAAKAKVVPGDSGGYKIKIEPVNPSGYMTFGGTSLTINAPLGDGTAKTIADALELKDTTAGTAVAALDDNVTITWAGSIGAADNSIAFNFGEIGKIEALSQITGSYTTKVLEQNGVPTGTLSSIEVDKNGFIIANFSNGKSQNIYKLALADFVNQNGLSPVSGNLFTSSKDAGKLSLKDAGQDGAGQVAPGALEGSNVDISEELASLIQIQRRFQASAKVINIEDKLSEELIHRTFA
jgi:flagellar hook protein FlgE